MTTCERYREEGGYPALLYVFFITMLLGGFLLGLKDHVFGPLVLLLVLALTGYLILRYVKEVEQMEPRNEPYKIYSGRDFYGGMVLISVSVVLFLSNFWPWFQLSVEV